MVTESQWRMDATDKDTGQRLRLPAWIGNPYHGLDYMKRRAERMGLDLGARTATWVAFCNVPNKEDFWP